MTNRRTRNPDSAADPADSTLEDKINQIENHVLRAREDVARLTEEIHRDVERLREAAAGLPAMPPSGPAAAADAVIPDLQSRVAALVAAELAGPALHSAVARVVDSRFRALTEALQAKVQQNSNPLQGLQLNPSRRRR